MINQKVRARWDRSMAPVGRTLARSRVSPNLLTLMGVLIVAAVAALIVDGRLRLAGFIAVAGGFADALDGAVAKAQGRTTKFGALLDSSTDRLSDALIFGSIAWFYGVAEAGPRETGVAAMALATLVLSFLVPYIRARAEGLGFECSVGIAERAERLILIIVGLVFTSLLPAIIAVIGVLSAVTIVQRLAHVRSQAERVA